MEIGIIDFVIVTAGWIVGNIVFNNFEKHLPWYRRLLKHLAILVLFFVFGALGGRLAFYSLLLLFAIGITILHAWWFPKHGIHGITAEPYDQYLELINKVKKRRQ
ncbi:MAG: hypothetical protein V3U68_06080 [Bacteroidota bacterium]